MPKVTKAANKPYPIVATKTTAISAKAAATLPTISPIPSKRVTAFFMSSSFMLATELTRSLPNFTSASMKTPIITIYGIASSNPANAGPA